MKKIFLPIVIIIILASLLLFIFARPNSKSVIKRTDPDPLPTTIPIQISTQENGFNISEYKVNWLIVRDLKRISLGSNLENLMSSVEIMENNNCSYLVNGNFYSRENTHLGLLVSDKKVLSPAIESNLFNGYFYVNESNQASITSRPPDTAKIALQSGPILIKNNQNQEIRSQSNDKARRIVIATKDNGDTLFMVIYDKGSVLSGPTLNELPEILSELEENTSINIRDALNLDGGSASAFITDEVRLTELSHIGSYFCIKQ